MVWATAPARSPAMATITSRHATERSAVSPSAPFPGPAPDQESPMRTPSEQHPETARPRRPLWAGALILLVAAFGCDKPTHPVAQVGRAWVGQPEWSYYLEDMLRREVAWQQAERRGLREGENWEAFKVQNRVAVLRRAYLDRQPGAP